jgi:hypothetical protein
MYVQYGFLYSILTRPKYTQYVALAQGEGTQPSSLSLSQSQVV